MTIKIAEKFGRNPEKMRAISIGEDNSPVRLLSEHDRRAPTHTKFSSKSARPVSIAATVISAWGFIRRRLAHRKLWGWNLPERSWPAGRAYALAAWRARGRLVAGGGYAEYGSCMKTTRSKFRKYEFYRGRRPARNHLHGLGECV